MGRILERKIEIIEEYYNKVQDRVVSTYSLSEKVRYPIKNGNITFDEGFYCDSKCCFSIDDHIQIGKDVLIGWNVDVCTSDVNTIFCKNDKKKTQTNYRRGLGIVNHCRIYFNVLF